MKATAGCVICCGYIDTFLCSRVYETGTAVAKSVELKGDYVEKQR
jgi:hypothetical protein